MQEEPDKEKEKEKEKGKDNDPGFPVEGTIPFPSVRSSWPSI